MSQFKDFARSLRSSYYIVQDAIIRPAARMWRRHSLIRETISGEASKVGSRQVAIYVHFDRDGLIHDYVVHQLRALEAAGYRITFVTNSQSFPAESRQRVAPHCHAMLWRFNTGYDFGAYKDGIASVGDLHELDALVLMNDSVYGPFSDLAGMLSAVDRTRADFWGIVDSWELRYHVQSFFLLFLPTALRSTAFREFWQAMPYVDNKGWVIRNGEVGLTQALAAQGLRGGVLAPYWTVAETMKDRLANLDTRHMRPEQAHSLRRLQSILMHGRPINAMHFFWDSLITDYKCPFIKRELLQSNPTGMPISAWRDVIQSAGSFDVAMIDDHLNALAAARR
ncbi:rhamnan synthesis F family protein [Rhodopseudomonas sp. HC1]|uniref:rhamnan synthesis F family protein n=1 Tax=Rhodopseudomonas infernalis TaxID=2897386 RepID=UPI001EE8717C|nr:rhamnan synthesis F family protein [Rhodopseudomonas infernalis]MCG6205019.1 rhamnan synthesis F family protein [Rhodopseudomonas infernalis]